MAEFKIEVDDQAVRAELGKLAARVGNISPMLAALGEDILARIKQRFNTETGPDGQKWPANKPATKRRKNGRSINFDRGDLRRQIFATVAGGALTVTSTPVYAAIRQFGGTIERAGGTKTIRHRTDAKGDLLRSRIMGGRGLIFAKDSHKRALARQVEVPAYKIDIQAAPFMPIRTDGTLYPAEVAEILRAVQDWLDAPSA